MNVSNQTDPQPDTVPLSVVITSTHGWPEIAPCLAALKDQIADVGGEIIVVDRSGAGLPAAVEADCPLVEWVTVPSATVFALRAEGLRCARGAIIASTEDHCVPSTDWCRQILRAHADHPDTLVIAGAVENGSTTRLVDWANYFMALCAFAPPVRAQRQRAVPIANVSYKRACFDGMQRFSPGWLEFDFNVRALERDMAAIDNGMLVSHVHSHSIVDNMRGNYHNGRSTTGLASDAERSFGRYQRVRRSMRRAWSAFFGTFLLMHGKERYRRALIASAPWMSVLCLAHLTGEVAGIVWGAGRSPWLVD